MSDETNEVVRNAGSATSTTAAGVEAAGEVEEAIPTVRVHIRMVNGAPEIDSNHLLPALKEVLKHLPKTKLAEVDRWSRKYGSNLLNAIQRSTPNITMAVWTNAIAEATMMRLKASNTEALTELHVIQDGYLAAGGMLYQLNPIQAMPTNRALGMMRKRAADAAKLQVNAIMQEARTTAQGVLRTAGETKRKADEELAKVRREHPSVPPRWAVENQLRLQHNGSCWQVGVVLAIKFRKFVMRGVDFGTEYTWEVTSEQQLSAQPVRVLVWVPLLDADGAYGVTSVRLDETSPKLPHMTTAAACMELGDAPARINGAAALQQLKSGIERCFQVVNLSSLYSLPGRWVNVFDAHIPPELKEALKAEDWAARVARLGQEQIAVVRRRVAEEAAAAVAPVVGAAAPLAEIDTPDRMVWHSTPAVPAVPRRTR